MKYRYPYGYDTYQASVDCGLKCEDPNLAIQSSKDEADINTIVRRFGVTGRVTLAPVPPLYGDFEGVFDYQSAQNLIVAARQSFMQLEPEVRKRFGNDPAAFVDFCSDERNLDEMRKMGLAVPKEEPAEDPPVPSDGQ